MPTSPPELSEQTTTPDADTAAATDAAEHTAEVDSATPAATDVPCPVSPSTANDDSENTPSISAAPPATTVGTAVPATLDAPTTAAVFIAAETPVASANAPNAAFRTAADDDAPPTAIIATTEPEEPAPLVVQTQPAQVDLHSSIDVQSSLDAIPVQLAAMTLHCINLGTPLTQEELDVEEAYLRSELTQRLQHTHPGSDGNHSSSSLSLNDQSEITQAATPLAAHPLEVQAARSPVPDTYHSYVSDKDPTALLSSPRDANNMSQNTSYDIDYTGDAIVRRLQQSRADLYKFVQTIDPNHGDSDSDTDEDEGNSASYHDHDHDHLLHLDQMDTRREREAAKWASYTTNFHNMPESERQRRVLKQRNTRQTQHQRERAMDDKRAQDLVRRRDRQLSRDIYDHTRNIDDERDTQQRIANRRDAEMARRMEFNKTQRDRHAKKELQVFNDQEKERLNQKRDVEMGRRLQLEIGRRGHEVRERKLLYTKSTAVRNRLETEFAQGRRSENREERVLNSKRLAEAARRNHTTDLRSSQDLADVTKMNHLQKREINRRSQHQDREVGNSIAAQKHCDNTRTVRAEREKQRVEAVKVVEAKEYTGNMARSHGNYKNRMSSIQL